MNTPERMIELYKERIDGYEHEYFSESCGEWMERKTNKNTFLPEYEYRRIEKPQTLEDAYNEWGSIAMSNDAIVDYDDVWNACAAWILKTGWKGDE